MDNNDLKEPRENISLGPGIGTKGYKKIYLIPQLCLKKFMLSVDNQTRDYYCILEDLMFDYIDKREDELQ